MTLAALAACSDSGGGGGGGSTGDGSSSTGSASATSTTSSTSATSSTDTSTSTDTLTSGYDSDLTIDGSGSTAGDLCDPNGFGPTCDPWTDDCPAGFKCAAFANDGGATWNDYHCVPLDPNAKQPGEPCTAPCGPTTGVDDCDVASMCWDIDPDTGIGECIPFCTGTPDAPQCADDCSECTISGDGVLILCLPTCDPLVDSGCEEGDACYPTGSGDFACIPDASGAGGALGETCAFTNACDPGLFCAPPQAVPDCDPGADAGCCASFCDVSVGDPCPGAAPGVECVAWWEPGQEPQDGCITAGLGACVLP